MGGVGPPLCKMGQLTYSMGPEWRGIRTCTSEPITPSKGFTYENPIIIIKTVYTLQQCFKNKPHEGVVNACFYTWAC